MQTTRRHDARPSGAGAPAPRRLGFTLVELMVVVAIIAVLAAIGSYAYGRVVKRARVNEAVTFMAAVGGAQEAYYNHYLEYASTADNDPPTAADYDPAAAEIEGRASNWNVPDARWAQIGVRLPGRTYFQYVVHSGAGTDVCNNPPGNTATVAPACASIVGDPEVNPPQLDWYYIVARGNQDGDTTFSVFGTSNTMGQEHWSEPELELE